MNIAVIGAGVIGLSSAIELLDRGFSVTVFARDLPPSTTSDVAAAFWFPFRVSPPDRALVWGKETFLRLKQFAQEPGSGVWIAPLEMFFDSVQPDPWWRVIVDTFHRRKPEEHCAQFADCFCFDTLLVDTTVHMPYLVQQFLKRGGEIRTISILQLSEIPAQFSAIVNCPGVHARELLDDSRVYPIRGQVLRVKRPAGVGRRVCVAHEGHTVTYVVVRENDCILGGTAEPNCWDLAANPETTTDIISRCTTLFPACRGLDVIDVRVGLRPGRDEVQLERDLSPDGRPLIHNYGHGGAGFTLNWGCALEVADLLSADRSWYRRP